MQEKEQINSGISERISEMVVNLGVSINQFAIILGYKRSQAVYDMINRKAKPSFDFFYKLLNSEYSKKIDIEYLITGRKRNQPQKGFDIQQGDSVFLDLFREKEKEVKELNREIGKLQQVVEQLKKGSPPTSYGMVAESELKFKKGK